MSITGTSEPRTPPNDFSAREKRELEKALMQRDKLVALSAFELGYICHEKGMNLQEAKAMFYKTWSGK